MRDNGLAFSGRLTWKGAGHMAGGEWMMRGKGPPGPKSGGRMDDTRQQGKGGSGR
jgi:hypothetical protein